MDAAGVTVGAAEVPRWAPPAPLAAAARFTRFSALGGTVLVPLLGMAAATPSPRPWLVAGLVGVAVAFHLFAYVLNDVVDLPVDRTEPRRSASPLVTGAVRPSQALGIALAQVPVAVALTLWLAADPASGPAGGREAAGSQVGGGAAVVALVALAVGFVLLAAYDLWGKRCRLPPVTDLAQGVGWGAMLLYGAAASGGATALAWLLAVYFAVFITLLNGVHGSLRDLANDYRHGVRSTAIWLGARPDGASDRPPTWRPPIDHPTTHPVGTTRRAATTRRAGTAQPVGNARPVDQGGLGERVDRRGDTSCGAGGQVGVPVIPARLVVYAASLQAVLVGIVVPAVLCCAPARGPIARVGGLALAVVLGVVALRLLSMISTLAPDERALRSAGMVHALANLALPVALVAPSVDWRLTAVLLALPVVPLLTHSWAPAAGAWAWQRLRVAARRVADLAWLARLHNAAVGGAATLVGAYLAGANVAAGDQQQRALRAALAALLVVACANAANDWHDVDEDRRNRPWRPLPSGRLPRPTAAGLAIALGLAGNGVALTLGPRPALAAAGLTVLSLAYCAWLKGTVLAGNATVGLLAACTLPFGALASGRPLATPPVGVAMLLTFLFMTAYEILGAVSDQEGDGLAGRRTIATRLGQATAIRAFQVLAAASVIALLVTWRLGATGTSAGVAVGATVALPLAVIAAVLRADASRRSVMVAHRVAKAAWPVGLLAMVLLR